MTNSCKDCAYTTCSQLHDYFADECKLSDGKPCQECVQLAILDSQISQVHSQLVQIVHKRHALKTKINQRHETLIHRLPSSVSSQIFEEYVHQVHSDFDPEEAYNSTHTRHWSPALFLSSICSMWRNIAFSTSEIWRFIYMPLREDDPDVDLKIKLLNESVDRACQRTLFIGVFQFQLDDEPRFSQLETKLNKLEPIFEAIKEIAYRSEEITLWGIPTPATVQLIIPTMTPNLKAVRIRKPFGRLVDMDGLQGWSNRKISLAGPLLRSLDFEIGGHLLESCKIGWDTITTVTMSGIGVKEGFGILRQASCLTSCSFIFYDDFDAEVIDPPIVNSTLETLHIDFSKSTRSRVDFVKFVNSVTLPSLRELSLQSFTLRDMKALFERSQCQIQTLSLKILCNYKHNILEDDVLELLSILPSVEYFSLDILNANVVREPIISDKFFESFRDPHFKRSRSDANPLQVLPKLKSFSYTGMMHFTLPAFLKIFPPSGNSLEAGRPLSKVSLKLHHLPKNNIVDHDVITKLREIQQSKIKLVVTDYNGKDLL